MKTAQRSLASSERNKAHNSQDTSWILTLYFSLQPPSHLFWALVPWLRHVSTWTPELAVRIEHSPSSKIPWPWGMPIRHLGLSPRSSSTSCLELQRIGLGVRADSSGKMKNTPILPATSHSAECFRLSLLWCDVYCSHFPLLQTQLSPQSSSPLSRLCFICCYFSLKVGVSASSLLPVNSGNDLAFKLFYLGFFISPILPPFSDFFFF